MENNLKKGDFVIAVTGSKLCKCPNRQPLKDISNSTINFEGNVISSTPIRDLNDELKLKSSLKTDRRKWKTEEYENIAVRTNYLNSLVQFVHVLYPFWQAIKHVSNSLHV